MEAKPPSTMRKIAPAAKVPTRYRVVGVRRSGTRDIRARNLGLATAEAVQIALLSKHTYRRVLIERQRRPR